MSLNLHPSFKAFFKFVNVNFVCEERFGELFQSLTILTKKEYLKELTSADLVCILYF